MEETIMYGDGNAIVSSAACAEMCELVDAFIELGSCSSSTSSAAPDVGGRISDSLAMEKEDDDEEAHHLHRHPSLTCTSHTATTNSIHHKISSHPLYPKLLQAYIDFYKVGAPVEVVDELDDISRRATIMSSTCLAHDPELDDFMEMYCDVLGEYKSHLERPLKEANEFITNMQNQLQNLLLCNNPTTTHHISSGADKMTISKRVGEHEIKERLMREYGEYMSSLKHEFSQRKKNGKLSQHARHTLLHWWSLHCNWPYPTEADKVNLAATTGLDRKQINNWFINQRKRHWKPSKNLHFNFPF